MTLEPRPNFFSIWRAVFSLLRRDFGLLLKATLMLAAPFFILNGVANANHMMSLADASMAGVMLPNETMRLLWGSLVGGDTLAMGLFSVAMLLVLKYMYSTREIGFGKYMRQQLPLLLKSGWFWLFFVMQIVVFGLVNLPIGPAKLGGMVLFACSVLMLLAKLDKDAPARGQRLRQLKWTGWVSLIVILLMVPVLYIAVNGYLNWIILMFTDLGAQQIAAWFPPNARSLPFGVIIVSKFLSQWLNLLMMVLLLSTYLAMRGSSSNKV